jgi:hypothetical protein
VKERESMMAPIGKSDELFAKPMGVRSRRERSADNMLKVPTDYAID